MPATRARSWAAWAGSTIRASTGGLGAQPKKSFTARLTALGSPKPTTAIMAAANSKKNALSSLAMEFALSIEGTSGCQDMASTREVQARKKARPWLVIATRRRSLFFLTCSIIIGIILLWRARRKSSKRFAIIREGCGLRISPRCATHTLESRARIAPAIEFTEHRGEATHE